MPSRLDRSRDGLVGGLPPGVLGGLCGVFGVLARLGMLRENIELMYGARADLMYAREAVSGIAEETR